MINKILKIRLELLFFIVIFIFYFSRYIYFGDGYLAFFDDDFFYYLETAFNFSQTGVSTFDNIHITNGYHPLWFIILSVITFIFGKSIATFYTISTIQVLTTYITYKQTAKLFQTILPSTSSTINNYLSIITTIVFMLIFKGGMEIILTVPLLLLLINISLEDKINSYEFGLISLLAILSRLDSVCFIIIYAIFLISSKRISVFKLSISMIPFLLYILSNILIFDTIMPISGMAKSLRSEVYFEFNIIRSFFDFTLNRIFYGTIPGLLIILNVVLVILNYKKIETKLKYLFISVIVFQISLILYSSLFSGWVYWSWYFYSVVLSYIITTYFIITKFKIKQFFILFVTISFLFYILAFSFLKKPISYDIYNEAQLLKKFEKHYIGNYGMGDRAGLPSFYIKSNLIQLEGLMMNREYLEDLQKLDLIDLLKKYNVEYYISYNPIKLDDKFIIAEPIKLFELFINSVDTISISPIDSAIVGESKFYLFNIDSVK